MYLYTNNISFFSITFYHRGVSISQRPSEKSYFIAKELLSTERTYRKDLEVISFVSWGFLHHQREAMLKMRSIYLFRFILLFSVVER